MRSFELEEILKQSLSAPLSLKEQQLLLLASWNLKIDSYYTAQLYEKFRSLGLVHVLVLSGAHLNCFYKMGQRILSFVMSIFSHYPSLFVREALLLVILAFYTSWNGFTAPLVRAYFCLFFRFFLPFSWRHWNFMCAFLLQFFFFSEHREERAFFLSWLSYLLLIFMNYYPQKLLLKSVLLMIFCQLLAVTQYDDLLFPGLFQWGNYLLGALFLLPLLEKVLFPLMGLWVFLSLILLMIEPQWISAAASFWSYLFLPVLRLLAWVF